ncbi:MAG: hypothetical protein NC180_10455 [Muribaculaceae bacterium]|nr:hypothetical protein [Roseburia sp.]MCM1432149.1 hypothetical protein [Muribaculaceae bacterium]MCM1493632.1 hypothetical protein [Muribaculaceae bacterium]MCM1560185.1 hypothetical protein [Butyrivibrio sp.]
MAVQIILCVETSKKADTDSAYILEAIRYYYEIDRQVRLSIVYMNTKSKYKAKDVVRGIEQKINMFTIGESKVIYCIDTDLFETNYEHKCELEKIQAFCESRSYGLIWFCHDVEEVFLGKSVSDSRKVKEAIVFKRQRLIEKLDAGRLQSSQKTAHTSNMLCILDKYLKRKKDVFQAGGESDED